MFASCHRQTVRVAGHPTSISLEVAFWRHFRRIAAERNISLNRLATHINAHKLAHSNLSSSIRLFILADLERHMPEVRYAAVMAQSRPMRGVERRA